MVEKNAYVEVDKLIKNDELEEGIEERNVRGLIQSQNPRCLGRRMIGGQKSTLKTITLAEMCKIQEENGGRFSGR